MFCGGANISSPTAGIVTVLPAACSVTVSALVTCQRTMTVSPAMISLRSAAKVVITGGDSVAPGNNGGGVKEGVGAGTVVQVAVAVGGATTDANGGAVAVGAGVALAVGDGVQVAVGIASALAVAVNVGVAVLVAVLVAVGAAQIAPNVIAGGD